ncbi:MAG TPA: hybrid sensor histidine kinase/response regulator [Kofleriaceae bacterium]|nr:hybrid sensor histidine kinase/response regulator [Kofleriaceae bacterium]
MNNEPLKILIVDDTPQNLVALEALLRRPELEVTSASSGAQALELLLLHEYAVALVDVQMPEMDGFELAELMRGMERTRRVPIIFVTAGARDPYRLFQGYEAGAVDFLYKPIEPQILASKVNVFLELARQRRQLAQALQLNELFVGILGHDLRNPLAAVLAWLDLLTIRTRDEEHHKILSRMKVSAERMQGMITELLDFTQVRFAPGLGLKRAEKPVQLHALLQRTIEELGSAHGGRELVLEGPPSGTLTGDPERLLQLFSNLITNALVHGTAGTRVTVRIVRCDQEATVEVHNEGEIPRDVIDTLFEPFKRPRSHSGGLGLGLYIAHQIAQAHSGRIEVRSSEAAGTVFTVHLPGASARDAA